jgi:hypothetical protein
VNRYKKPVYISLVIPSGLAKSPEAYKEGTACNQRCPSCALLLSGEGERSLVSPDNLSPGDIVRFIRDIHTGLKGHTRAQSPIAEVAFHGYEVTIPGQWEWVKAIVRGLGNMGTNFEFITNGMMLHHHRHDVVELGINRVTVSMDGNLNPFDGLAYIHDRYRGIKNATLNTCSSLTRFIYGDPDLQWDIAALAARDPQSRVVKGIAQLADHYKCIVGIGSVLYGPSHPVSRQLGHTNFVSLKNLPATMARLGLNHWTLSPELVRAGDAGGTKEADDVPWEEMAALVSIADSCGITTYVLDTHGKLASVIARLSRVHDLTPIEQKRRFIFRMLAGSGHVNADFKQPIMDTTPRLTRSVRNAFQALGGLDFFPDEAEKTIPPHILMAGNINIPPPVIQATKTGK